ELGMSRVFIHPLAGVLSAYGMGLADQIAMRETAVEQELNELGVQEARELALRLRTDAGAELQAQGVSAAALLAVTRVHIRYQGTDTALSVELPLQSPAGDAVAAIRAGFADSYRRRFAFLMPNQALVIESVSVECIAPGAGTPSALAAGPMAGYEPAPDATLSMYCFADQEVAGRREARLFRVEALRAGASIDGPAILAERNATAHRAPCGGHPGRSGDARVVQQCVHEYRRTNGIAPAEHRLLGEHQGAAGFQLRFIRSQRVVDPQCPAYAGAPGIDERVDPHRHRTQSADEKRRCVCLERSLPRRHASAGCDRGDAGVSAGRRRSSQFFRGIARPSRRYRR